MGRSREIKALAASITTSPAVIMSDSVDSEASKKGRGPMPPATDGAQVRDAPAFLTEGVLLRFEQGLRAQREQRARSDQPSQADGAEEPGGDNEGRRFSGPDAAYSLPGARALGKSGLLLCALLLVVAGAALGVSLKARTAGSSDAAPVNIEAQASVEAPRSAASPGVQTIEPAEPPQTATVPSDSDEPRQPIRNAMKSPAATPSVAPALPAPVEEPATPAASEAAAAAETPVEDKDKAKRARTRSRGRHTRFGHRR